MRPRSVASALAGLVSVLALIGGSLAGLNRNFGGTTFPGLGEDDRGAVVLVSAEPRPARRATGSAADAAPGTGGVLAGTAPGGGRVVSAVLPSSAATTTPGPSSRAPTRVGRRRPVGPRERPGLVPVGPVPEAPAAGATAQAAAPVQPATVPGGPVEFNADSGRRGPNPGSDSGRGGDTSGSDSSGSGGDDAGDVDGDDSSGSGSSGGGPGSG